jgi:hypothetical protein
MTNTKSPTKDGSSNSISKFPLNVKGDTIQSQNSSNTKEVYIDLPFKYKDEGLLDSFGQLDPYYLTNIEFNKIKRLYRLINEDELKMYFEVNLYLYSILINGINIIREIIGNDVIVSLELYTFIEERNKSIFLTIYTNNEEDIQDEIEDIIVNKLLSYSSKPLNGKIVISVS